MEVLQLWGKTAQDGDYHPALFHMIDVGHVAQLLLQPPATPRIRRVLAHAFEVENPDDLVGWLPLVVAFHDIGKISSLFQRLAPDQVQRLESQGFDLGPKDDTLRHQHLSAALCGELTARLPELREIIAVFRDTLAGHHGTFASQQLLRRADRFSQFQETEDLREMRVRAIDRLIDVFPLSSPPPVLPKILRVATAALTGFMILCDWLGSDEHIFTPMSALSLDRYLPVSRERAHASAERTGFLQTRPEVRWAGFRPTFPGIDDPRPLQQAIDELPDVALGWPSLHIIEAPTGEGKTEAALALARRLGATGWSDEFYFALPTTATSNQMHGRVREYLDRIYDGQVAAKLIHGQAALFQESLKAIPYGNPTDVESPAAAVPQWFSPKKLALLAPFGVGTVDQAELTVLSARHYVLRLFGLAGKVVIIDEVHAYDTYMNTIIDHALWWFASIGTSVILLSATLPVARHREMASAFRRGLSQSSDEAVNADLPFPYPVIASYTSTGSSICTPHASQPNRPLVIEFVPDLICRGPDHLFDGVAEAKRLLDLVEGGGAVCRITNTVDRAQAIYHALRTEASSGVELHLLHARMPGDDRLAREAEIAERLGPKSSRTKSDQIIVVGTQVLEQSLDLDFDLMISDHAPLDLLLQRAGRLFRHNWRTRPDAFPSACLQVVLSLENGAPNFGDSAYVYQPFVLWKSWLVLRSRQDTSGRIELSLPDDYRPLIEATYDGRRDVLDSSDPLRASLDAAWKKFADEEQDFAQRAKQRLIPEPTPGNLMSAVRVLTFDEDEDGGSQGWGFAATRLGRESITVVPLHRTPAGLSLTPSGLPLKLGDLDREQQLALARRGMRVSNQTIVRALRDEPSPERGQFERLPLLRNAYPLILENERMAFKDLVLQLDPELGLVIRKVVQE